MSDGHGARGRTARPGRTRRRFIAGGLLTTLGVLTAAIWLQSAWWYRGYEGASWAVSCYRGIVTFDDGTGWAPPSPAPTSATPTIPSATPFMDRGSISFSPGIGMRWWRWTVSSELAPSADPATDTPIVYRSILGLAGTYSISSSPWTVNIPPRTAASPGGAPVRVVELALWPLPAVLLPAGLALLTSAWLARRSARRNLCRRCGYSREGIAPGAPCPECGNPART